MINSQDLQEEKYRLVKSSPTPTIVNLKKFADARRRPPFHYSDARTSCLPVIKGR